VGVETLLRGAAGRATTARRILVAVLLAAGLAEILAAPVPPTAFSFGARDETATNQFAPSFKEAATLAGSGRR